MTTIARQATIRIANATSDLAQLVTKAQLHAEFAAIVADIDFATVTVDADEHEFEFTCEWTGHGTDEIYVRIDNRDGHEISVCEYHADHADVSRIAD